MEFNETMKFNVNRDPEVVTREVMDVVYQALKEKGYNPVNQIVGYFLSGDPSYITSHLGARTAIRKLERDELLEEIVKFYVNKGNI